MQTAVIPRIVLGAERIRRTDRSPTKGLRDHPSKGLGLSQFDKTTESSVGVRRGGVEEDTRHWVRGVTVGVDAFSNTRGVVSALQRQLSNQQVRESV